MYYLASRLKQNCFLAPTADFTKKSTYIPTVVPLNLMDLVGYPMNLSVIYYTILYIPQHNPDTTGTHMYRMTRKIVFCIILTELILSEQSMESKCFIKWRY